MCVWGGGGGGGGGGERRDMQMSGHILYIEGGHANEQAYIDSHLLYVKCYNFFRVF